jgi:hypothetical protein
LVAAVRDLVVSAGHDHLLAVDGRELRYPDDLDQRFEPAAGRLVEITVGPPNLAIWTQGRYPPEPRGGRLSPQRAT